MILEKIKEANDVKQLSLSECEQLAQEIRDFLIRSLSETGGHLASNLGVVELTIALHRFLHFPEDKLVWDVGHQAYTHKILTGRKEQFATLRKTGGLSGFPKRKESDCDAFDTGHSSTSISAGLSFQSAQHLFPSFSRTISRDNHIYRFLFHNLLHFLHMRKELSHFSRQFFIFHLFFLLRITLAISCEGAIFRMIQS